MTYNPQQFNEIDPNRIPIPSNRPMPQFRLEDGTFVLVDSSFEPSSPDQQKVYDSLLTSPRSFHQLSANFVSDFNLKNALNSMLRSGAISAKQRS